jgi:hypothetical protein
MQLLTNINQEIVRKAELEPDRYHLGGSQIGDKCLRKLLYGFRKASKVRFHGRMHRLFNRGHEEEFRFVRWLRNANLEVREYAERLVFHEASGEYSTIPWDREINGPEFIDCSQDEAAITIARIQHPALLKQWRIVGYRGHFSGSLDGMGMSETDEVRDSYMSEDKVKPTTNNVIPAGTWFLLEFKTHNFKSFTKLVDAKSVKIIKPVHYAQMQVYMHFRNLKFALYCAVNKNDDDLYFEIVPYDERAALSELTKSETVIDSISLPDRIPGASPALFDCKYCDYCGPCHRGEPMVRSCRSCKFVRATDNQSWTCAKFNSVIPLDYVLKGCDQYSPMTD